MKGHDQSGAAAPGHAFRSRRPSRSSQPHVLACTCFRGLPLIRAPAIRDRLSECIELARQRCGIQIDSWVILPAAARLLVTPRRREPEALREFLRLFKSDFARQMITRWRARKARILHQLVGARGRVRIWQPSPEWDREVRSEAEMAERRAEIHLAPVARGLVDAPEDWAWSSARWYRGDRTGLVQIEPL